VKEVDVDVVAARRRKMQELCRQLMLLSGVRGTSWKQSLGMAMSMGMPFSLATKPIVRQSRNQEGDQWTSSALLAT
jgi:hypothetical protein